MAKGKSTKKPASSAGSIRDRFAGLLNRSAKPTKKKTAAQANSGMSLDRRLDITGVVIALVGILTLLALLSPNRSGMTSLWVNLWRTSLGWGIYFFPLVMLLFGVWLIARNFENVPA